MQPRVKSCRSATVILVLGIFAILLPAAVGLGESAKEKKLSLIFQGTYDCDSKTVERTEPMHVPTIPLDTALKGMLQPTSITVVEALLQNTCGTASLSNEAVSDQSSFILRMMGRKQILGNMAIDFSLFQTNPIKSPEYFQEYLKEKLNQTTGCPNISDNCVKCPDGQIYCTLIPLPKSGKK
jgi:hypothetical protein